MKISNEDREYLKKCFPDKKEYLREYNKLWRNKNKESVKRARAEYAKTKKCKEYQKNYYFTRKNNRPLGLKEKWRRYREKKRNELTMLREFYNKYKDWVPTLEKE